MSIAFPDHFSTVAADYQRFRPHYPAALFAHLASLAPARELAWDCGTGNGQAAVALATHFQRVIATDASAEQIREAPAMANVEYRVATAENAQLAPGSVDLVVVAQAVHWFDHSRFFHEVKRVLKPHGMFAAFGYRAHRVNPVVDAVIDRFEALVGPYWPPERALLEARYRTIDFPFDDIAAPEFPLSMTWTHAVHLGYLRTWSAVKMFVKARGYNPVDAFADEFRVAWGEGERLVSWDLPLYVGCTGK